MLGTLPGTGNTLINTIDKNAYLFGMFMPYSIVEKNQ